MKIADKTYYLDADKKKALAARTVKEGEDETPDGAAYLLVRAGGEVTAEMEEQYGVKGTERAEEPQPAGVTISDVGGASGFVAASDLQARGQVVTDAAEAPAAAPAKSAKKATKSAKK